MKITNIEIEEGKKLVKAHLEGKLISGEQNQAYLEFVEEQLEKGINHFLLDLSKLDFINSSGIGAIMISLKRIANTEGRIAVCCCQKQVSEIFIVTRMQKKLGLCKTKEEALKYLNA